MTHEPMCPCNKADERGCFLISAETGKCISCVCGNKMGAYLDGYAAGVQAARAAVAGLDTYSLSRGVVLMDALAAIDAVKEGRA